MEIKVQLSDLGMAIFSKQAKSLLGRVGSNPEDFIVEEIPLYSPVGEGEHCYYLLTKKNRNTIACVKEIAKQLNIKEMEVGYAGLKDKNAITRQVISVRMTNKEAPQLKVGGEPLQFLGRHLNKIKVGHLKGNLFRLRLVDLPKDYEEALSQKLAYLEQHGVPNYFGTQRFGNRLNNHLAGLAVLKNDFKEACRILLGAPKGETHRQVQEARRHYEENKLELALQTYPPYYANEKSMIRELMKGENREKRAYLKCDRKTREILFNACQSFLFNQFVSKRLKEGLKLLKGDVALLSHNMAPFLVEDPIVENARLLKKEIHLGGPLFGDKMFSAKEESLSIENEILALNEISLEEFSSPSVQVKFQGARRPILAHPQEVGYQVIDHSTAEIKFFLPSGSYATVVLQEIFHRIHQRI